MASQGSDSSEKNGGANEFILTPPAISTPKGGGAIRGIDEKFQVNPATGTGSLTIPIFTSPGRQGFGPQLALGYDSGAGNGPFGLGWSLAVPNISRKTDKGLPRYQDGIESDVFPITGAEDLVPALMEDSSRWQDERLVEGVLYRIHRYRPRTEGLFACIERWTQHDDGDVHWRATTPANVTSIYGRSPACRIADPDDGRRVFSWLLEETHDDRGNVLFYEYKQEDGARVDRTLPQEANRLRRGYANRYLKRISYGNSSPYFPNLADFERAAWVEANRWHFQVLFDYGEYDELNPSQDEISEWALRPDGFSSFRAGFEIRTQRLCRRVLMFHNFPDEAGFEAGPYLVRSTNFVYDETPVAAYLAQASQSGYFRQARVRGYLTRSLPPIEFTYTVPEIEATVRSLDPGSLENLPSGLGGARYRWVDLDGEGISGLLTEQGEGWFYKRNLGSFRFSPSELSTVHPPPPPAPRDPGAGEPAPPRFAASRLVAKMPSVADMPRPQQQLMDLAGDGQLDLVLLGGATDGFFEREAGAWSNFRPFRSEAQVAWGDPHLRLVDISGDGHADILVSHADGFTWYPSQAEQGFGAAEFAGAAAGERRGPTLAIADATQSIYLADMAGDGLPDILRIRNGEICYWPNLGYGAFGAQVTMGNSPNFDHPDQFDQRRVRLADIDGSGTTDIVYLGRQGVDVYFNQAGNSWAARRRLPVFPQVDHLSDVTVADLLGNGTACLVWSSPLPGDAHHPLRYVDLMGGNKPHLLSRVVNNMGAETRLSYAPSTRFYIADEQAGRPWITRLPFPVHVVESVEVLDRISQTRYVSRYRYHHGFYDGEEREFRGFGLVEQWDSDLFLDYDRERATGSPHAGESALHQPPVYTKSWFHTGAYLEGERISQQYAIEYYGAPRPGDPDYDEALRRFTTTLLPDTLFPAGLSADERPEAARALRGQMLRQEVYAVDGDLEKQGHPYTVTEQNFSLRRVQPRRSNRHAVFLSVAREAISYHYERDPHDPRLTHAFTLDVDDYGNVTRSAAVAYPRRLDGPAVEAEQRRLYITCSEAGFTNRDDPSDFYLIGVPTQSRSYELTGVPAPGEGLFTWADIGEQVRLAAAIPYEAEPSPGALQKRLLSHSRSRYYASNLAEPLPLGQVAAPLLPFENYKAAFSEDYLSAIFGDRLPPAARPGLLAGEGGYIFEDGLWWLRSGRQEFVAESVTAPAERQAAAQARFYLPTAVVDPFGGRFTQEYDRSHLLATRTEDPLHNVVVAEHDYRVLQAWQVSDPNGNRAQAAFDALGMVVGTAMMGKDLDGDGLPDEGDTLAGFQADLEHSEVRRHLDAPDPRLEAHRLLGNATTRLVYDLWRYHDTQDEPQPQPNLVWTLARETHASALTEGEVPAIQHTFLYSDGVGREILTKVQAEPGPLSVYDPESGQWRDEWAGPGETPFAPRWVGSGRTVFNNKGKPVKQYEPFFAATHRYQSEAEAIMQGVTPVIQYDPLGRAIRTDHPDGTHTRVDFDPWGQTAWDANDTVLESDWYARRMALPDDPEHREARRSAALAAAHAGTPATVLLDSLARPFLALADNHDDHLYRTHTALDIQGQPQRITDDRGNPVMIYQVELPLPGGEARHVCGYDMAGRGLFQGSMDAGRRWTLPDAAGKQRRAWNELYRFRTTYDALQRPENVYTAEGDGREILVERMVYGESLPGPETANLRGQVCQAFDSAGVVIHHQYDFKGNLLHSERWLPVEYKTQVNWDADPTLESETFTSRSTYDALNRPLRLTAPDASVVIPGYNEAGLLERMDIHLRGAATATPFVTDIDYNAKGQRTRIAYGNGAATEYIYDPETFRLERLVTQRLAAPTRLQDLRYTYDPVADITAIRDEAQQSAFFDNVRVEAHSRYEYDALYRLVRAEGREHAAQNNFQREHGDFEPVAAIPFPNSPEALQHYTEEYGYDAVGNLLSMTHTGGPAGGWRRRYAYAADSNRLLSTSLPGDPADGPFSAAYTYNAHGSMASMPHLPLMKWDYMEQLSASSRQARDDGGIPETTYYVYDGAGQRIHKVTERQAAPGETSTRKKERIYLGGFEVYREYDASGEAVTLERQTLHVMDGEQRIALVETRTRGNEPGIPAQLTRYQLGNHLGSACLELDEAASVISYEEYHPYGTTTYRSGRSAVEVSLKRYRCTGMERDEETGLSYHTARYYATWLGRWCRVDPGGLVDGENLYRYSRDNPIAVSDPNGMDPPDPRNFSTLQGFLAASTGPYSNEYLTQIWEEAHMNDWLEQQLPSVPLSSMDVPNLGVTRIIDPELLLDRSRTRETASNPGRLVSDRDNSIQENAVSGASPENEIDSEVQADDAAPTDFEGLTLDLSTEETDRPEGALELFGRDFWEAYQSATLFNPAVDNSTITSINNYLSTDAGVELPLQGLLGFAFKLATSGTVARELGTVTLLFQWARPFATGVWNSGLSALRTPAMTGWFSVGGAAVVETTLVNATWLPLAYEAGVAQGALITAYAKGFARITRPRWVPTGVGHPSEEQYWQCEGAFWRCPDRPTLH